MSDSETSFSFNENDADNLDHRKIIWVTPKINKKSVKMDLDTGAGVSVLSKRDSEMLWPKAKLKNTKLASPKKNMRCVV